MKSRRWSLVLSALGVALLSTASVAAASDSESARLKKKRDSERYEVRTPHSSIKAGAARVHIAAPTASVQKVVLDFKNYDSLSSRFEKSKVVGRDGDKTDVYLQVPILKGAAKVWAIVRFEPMKKVGNEHVLEGKMIKGNVRRLDATWRIKSVDEDDSQLNLELLIVPKLPVPGSVVTGEVAYAADLAVMGSRNRAEKDAKKK